MNRSFFLSDDVKVSYESGYPEPKGGEHTNQVENFFILVIRREKRIYE